MAVWTAVVGLAVLIHELGHAFAARSIGAFPTIELHGFGGLTRWTAPARTRWTERVFVSLAGPAAGFLAAGLLVAAERNLEGLALNRYVRLALSDFWWASLVWGGLNLLPVWPLDGGQTLHTLLQRYSSGGWRWSRIVSCVVGSLAAAALLYVGQPLGAALFGLLAYSAFNQLKGRPGIRIGGLG